MKTTELAPQPKWLPILVGGNRGSRPSLARLSGRTASRRLSPLMGVIVAVLLSAAAPAVTAESRPPGQSEVPRGSDGSGEPDRPTLYVVGTAHLDTQWLWTIQDTIRSFVPRTLRDNFALFEKYPGYVFSFEGAFRYKLAKEYEPGDYAKLKTYIASGRWRVAGSSMDAGDVNIPAPESLIRQILYGNGFFRREFGRASADIYLPDCFGFGWALPSVAAHCGLRGFSTQKLTWGSSVGIPFDIGLWEGVDGSRVIAALNPGDYVSTIDEDLSRSPEWQRRIEALGRTSGDWVGYRYFGTGDQGGAPSADSVSWLERSLTGQGTVRVLSTGSDQLYRDLAPGQLTRLPRYRGELLMTKHGTGCYTSQGAMKRWNRRNEQLAAAAERVSVIADWLGGAPYPRDALSEAWIRILWHHHHDDITGTSTPLAYPFSWNDEILSMKAFGGVLADGIGAATRALDTRVEGVPIVVFNPLSREREDIVDAVVRFEGATPRAVRVFAPNGREVPSQIARVGNGEIRVLFLARAPSMGFVVYDVRRSAAPCSLATGLRITDRTLENGRYRVRLNDAGEIASVLDTRAKRDLLSAPAPLQMFTVAPGPWPEWEIGYADLSGRPREQVGGPVTTRILEKGPARASIEVTRTAGASTITQRIRLGAGGAADRVEIDTSLDWRTPATLLKAAFPLSVRNRRATYDLGLGTIERPNDTETLYEVPAQQWADLTAVDGSYGVGIVNDGKYGWDKPDDGTLRLSLVHAPPAVEKDFGRHRFLYALAGHRGGWRDGDVPGIAERVNQPLAAFQTRPHPGPLGREFSMLRLNTAQISVSALKMAEESEEVIVRVFEEHGRPAPDVRLSMAAPIRAVREVTGAERPLEESLAVGAAARNPTSDSASEPTVRASTDSGSRRRALEGSMGASSTPALPVRASSSILSASRDRQSSQERRDETDGDRSRSLRSSSARGSGAGGGNKEPSESVRLVGGALRFSMKPYRPRTFAIRMGKPPLRLAIPVSSPVPLDFDADVVSAHDAPGDGDFDGSGHSLPAELLPKTLVRDGIRFELGGIGPHERNALTCHGQSLDLERGRAERIYILAAARGGDRAAAFRLDGRETSVTVHEFTGFVGQSQSLVVDGRIVPHPWMDEPYIKEAPIAWVGTHRHDARIGADPYVFTYLYAYGFDLSFRAPNDDDDARRRSSLDLRVNDEVARRGVAIGSRVRLTLPDDPSIRILAITLVEHPNDDTHPANDVVERIAGTRIRPRGGISIQPVRVSLACDRPGAALHYTVNGGEPTESDPLYKTPFTIDRDAVIRARAFFGATAEDDVAVRWFTFTTPRPPIETRKTVRGLLYDYYEGAWRDLSGLAASSPAASGTADAITADVRKRESDFGLRFHGFVEVPRDGVYTFTTRSDDGSALRIGEVLVVDNDGLHGAREQSGQIALAAGRHPIEVQFFQRGGDIELAAEWEGPGITREAIPASALSHAP